MPNLFDANGLQTATRAELVTYFTTQYQAIYGNDINLDSSTPDGQMMNIFIQAILDLEDLLVQINNSFDPDLAIGNVLAQRGAINGIQPQAGTFTVTNVTVVVSQSVNLYGVDQDDQEVFTVSDNAGNKWVLQVTQLGVSIGSHVYAFQAVTPGAQLTVPNTITVPVTVVLGVTSVNNPTTYTTLGINQESDAAFRIRRQKSVSLASQGYLKSLLAALENVTGVTVAFVYENNTSSTDSDGIPGHSIWVIVGGSGASADIAQAIYAKRNAGCGMRGTVTYTITQVDDTPFVVRWDVVVTRSLFIKFTATSINGVTPPNIEAIQDGLVVNFAPGVNSEVNINQLATDVQIIDPNTLVTNAGFSLANLQTILSSGSPSSGAFKVKYNGNTSAAINWNDDLATTQTKIRAVSGLSTAVVTGLIDVDGLVIDLTSLSDVATLISVVDNTLSSFGDPVTLTCSTDYEFTLLPPSKQNQFVVAADNILILPMIMNPPAAQVAAAGTVQYSGLGGYGSYVYSILTNNSSGSINASTGLYTAGAVRNVIDTVKITDELGNTATALVSVI